MPARGPGRVLSGGKIGLRQMQWTVGRYRNLRVYALKPAAVTGGPAGRK